MILVLQRLLNSTARIYYVGFGSKADMCSAQAHVRFVPKADIGPALDGHSDARQDGPDFGELPRLRIDLNRPAMLLDDDVVANGQAKTGAFSSSLLQ